MARLSQRFFALFFAILFLVTSSSIAIAYILSNIQSKDASKTASQKSQTSSTSANKLAGTKLTNFTPVSNSSVTQLEATDTMLGTGATVKAGDTVNIDYTGALASTGVIFQSSLDSGKPIALTLKTNSAIAGFVQGLVGMKVGGVRRLLIPASLGYGSLAQPGIPANSALVFDVTLHSIAGQ